MQGVIFLSQIQEKPKEHRGAVPPHQKSDVQGMGKARNMDQFRLMGAAACLPELGGITEGARAARLGLRKTGDALVCQAIALQSSLHVRISKTKYI